MALHSPLPALPSSPFVQNNLEINNDMKSTQDTLPVHIGVICHGV